MRADEFSGDGRGMFQRERDSQRQVDEKKIKEGRVKKKEGGLQRVCGFSLRVSGGGGVRIVLKSCGGAFTSVSPLCSTGAPDHPS